MHFEVRSMGLGVGTKCVSKLLRPEMTILRISHPTGSYVRDVRKDEDK